MPLLPLAVPGAAVSPGASSCNLLKAPRLTTTLADVAGAPGRPGLAKSMLIVVATLCERLVKLTTPLTAARLVAPCKAPLPAFRLAVTTVLLSLARKLPKASSIRTTGCGAKATPAVAAAEGWVWIVSRLAAAGLTATVVEVTPARPGLLKVMVMLVAMLCAKSVKLTMPPMAVRLVVPCKAPLPAARAALTAVE